MTSGQTMQQHHSLPMWSPAVCVLSFFCQTSILILHIYYIHNVETTLLIDNFAQGNILFCYRHVKECEARAGQ